jgi:hypothetical protein
MIAFALLLAALTSPDTLPLCDGKIVSTVEVNAQRPPFRGEMAIWRRVARSVGLHNTSTRPEVIRRFVTLEAGGPCTEFRRAESERLLRAQPFLASAAVVTTDDGEGGVRVDVTTVDEVPAIVGARFRDRSIRSLKLGNENLYGHGVRLELNVERGYAYRNGVGGRFVHHQMFGRPYTLGVEVQQRPIGERAEVELGHPYLTDLQRFAWHVGVRRDLDYLPVTREPGGLVLAVERASWDAGGVARIGGGGRTWLIGGVLTGEQANPRRDFVSLTDSGMVIIDDHDQVITRFEGHRAVRPNLVLGIRELRFTPATGFDALTAKQDIATGFQVGLVGGPSLRVFGDRDLFVSGELFAGVGHPMSYAGLQVEGEARRDLEEGDWDGTVASGRAAWYIRNGGGSTTILSVEGAGGWRMRLPFQLLLGDHDSGIRGFGRQHVFGARRVVARGEHRWAFANVLQRADLGLAGFVDVGRLWSGDAPYGRAVPFAASVGVSLLGAAPSGAQRMARVDIALPVAGPARHRVELRLAFRNWTNPFWREPGDVRLARGAAVPARIFSWP